MRRFLSWGSFDSSLIFPKVPPHLAVSQQGLDIFSPPPTKFREKKKPAILILKNQNLFKEEKQNKTKHHQQ